MKVLYAQRITQKDRMYVKLFVRESCVDNDWINIADFFSWGLGYESINGHCEFKRNFF